MNVFWYLTYSKLRNLKYVHATQFTSSLTLFLWTNLLDKCTGGCCLTKKLKFQFSCIVRTKSEFSDLSKIVKIYWSSYRVGEQPHASSCWMCWISINTLPLNHEEKRPKHSRSNVVFSIYIVIVLLILVIEIGSHIIYKTDAGSAPAIRFSTWQIICTAIKSTDKTFN